MTSDRPEFGQPLPKVPDKGKPKPTTPRPPDEDRVDDYRHEGASRLNLPEAGIATQDRSIAEPRKYEYDPHLARRAGTDSSGQRDQPRAGPLATPYYLSGSGHAEGEPFGWIVSDFSLGAPLEVQRWRSPELMLR